jgi:Lrp/AsnC family transcriptional regulator for asnA, asnC and gidA
MQNVIDSVEVMDTLNRQIIQELQFDGRLSNAAIARHMNVSEGTVRRRVNQMVKNGTIKIRAMLNPEKMGFNTVAIIGIRGDPDKLDDVARSLSAFPETEYVSLTTGSFDMFIWVALPSSEALGEFLRRKVGIIEGIRSTETFVNLAICKNSFGVLV